MASRSLVELIISARNTAGSVIRSFGDQLGSAKVAVAGLTAALAGLFGGVAVGKFFGDALASARSFEEQMSVVAAKSGATADELEILTQSAQEMGSSTRFSATEAAQGLEILATAGVSATDSVKLLPTVLQVAQGAGIGLAESASILTDSLGILGKSVDDAGELADVLSKGALLANTSVSQLGQALKVAGGSARAAGLDLQQTTAALDALANNGVKSAEAGTALRNLLNELRNPASKARAALLQLGITTGDLPTILQRLEGNTAGVSRVLDALTVDAQIAGRALFNVGATGFAEFDRKLRAAQGTAQQTADVMDQNLNGALRGLSSAFDGFRQALVQPLLEPIREQVLALAAALQKATNDGTIDQFRDSLVNGFNTVVQAVRDFISEFDFQAALNSLGEFTETASEKLNGLVNTGRGLADTLRIIVGSFEAIINAGAAAIEKAGSLSLQALERLPGPLSLITKQIAGAFESVALGAEDLDRRSREHFANALESISGIGESLDRIATGYNKTADSQRRAAQTQDEYAIAAREAAIAQEAVNRSQEDAVPVIERIIDGTKRLNQSLDDTGQQAGAMSDEIKAAFKTLGLDTQQELELVRDTAKNLFEELKKSGTGTAEDLKRAFMAYADAAREAAELSTDAAKEALEVELEREAAILGIVSAKDKETDATRRNADAIREEQRAKQGISDEIARAAAARRQEKDAIEQANRAQEESAKVAETAKRFTVDLGDAWRSLTAAQKEFILQNEGEISFGFNFLQAHDRIRDYIGGLRDAADAMVILRNEYFDLINDEQALARATEASIVQFKRLGDEEMATLRYAIQDAKGRMQSLADTAESTFQRLRQELARLRGEELLAQSIENQQKLIELEERLQQAKSAGNADAIRFLNDAIALQRQINREREREIELRERQNKAPAERPRSGNNQTPAGAGAASPITFNVNGVLDEKLVRRDIIPILNRVLRRSA